MTMPKNRSLPVLVFAMFCKITIADEARCSLALCGHLCRVKEQHKTQDKCLQKDNNGSQIYCRAKRL